MEWVYEGEEGGDIDLTGYGEMFLQQVKLSIHPFLVSFWHSVAVTVNWIVLSGRPKPFYSISLRDPAPAVLKI